VVSEHVIHSARAFYLYHRISSQAPETEKGVLANAYYHLGWMYQDGIGTNKTTNNVSIGIKNLLIWVIPLRSII
jgi:hypothetical protein